MTHVVSLASTKGGVGKTTTIMALASEARRRGLSALLVDCDANRHLAEWAARVDPPGLTVIDGVGEGEIRSVVQGHAAQHDLTLIDLAGFGNLTMMYAFSVSDVVLVPVQQSYMDIKEAARTYRLVTDSIGVLRHTPPCYLLFTRLQAAIESRVDRHAAAELLRRNIPAFGTRLIERALLKEMSYSGRGPGEIDSGSNAAANIAALADELDRVLAEAPLNPMVPRRAHEAESDGGSRGREPAAAE